MVFITTYTLKPYRTKEETSELMRVFSSAGSGQGTVAHYVSADGGGGVVISETDDIGPNYRNILNYTQWVTYETKVMLSIDDAVPHIMDALA